MKRFLLVLLAIVFLIGCNGMNFGAPKIPSDLCSEYDASTSYLLKISSEREVPLNEVYYGLLDMTQIGLIVEALEREKVAEFMNNLAEWYNDHYPISYLTLIDFMTDEAAKVQGVTAIINRRAGIYKSSMVIGNYDNCLLRAGWSNAMDELYLR